MADATPQGLDPIGMFIVTLHNQIGHDKAAAFIGQPAGDKRACVICQHERRPTDLTRHAVYLALAPEVADDATTP